ncbi:MAG TPA: aldo/keto reductase [Ktedonobacterales bacterium]|jgi:aryl-alcohol dehydrogenase-like predicted oxidoreductase|nr:aldo/keto reductase [Ktedonobacterales bacterium]
MRYRELGSTGIAVSEVGFGVWTVSTSWWGVTERELRLDLLRRAWDLGITLYDTADTYGNGYGEEILVEAFGARRDGMVISTKFGYDIYNHPGERQGQQELPQNVTPEFVRFALEQSLRRLQTDHIDIYMLHNPKRDHALNDDLWALLGDFQREGKVRAYGASIGPRIGWRDEGVLLLERQPITALQLIHNLLEQDPGRAFIAAAREHQVGLMARVPHSSGLLEGGYDEQTTFPPGDHRNHRSREWLTTGLRKVRQLDFLTTGTDRTLGQAAIKWLLAEPLMATTLPNIYNVEQLEEFAAAPDTPDLTSAELARVATLYGDNFGADDVASSDSPSASPSTRWPA